MPGSVKTYLDHFHLRKFPFRLTPDPALLFRTEEHNRAFNMLTQAARSDCPVTKILGETGTGKTTLLRHFASNLPRDMRAGMISNYSSGLGGLGGLSRWLHSAFGQRAAGPESELWAAFEAYLVAQHHDGVCCLLIVDEAQNVANEDIDALISLTRLPALPGVSMRLVLAGQPRLRRSLPASHDREEAGESTLVQIGPMSSEDVGAYVRHRLAMAGSLNPVFDEEAIGRIARLTDGVPRLVNGLCELLLISAFGAGKMKIGSTFVDHVLQDSRQSSMIGQLLTRPNRSASRVPTPMKGRAPSSTSPARRARMPVKSARPPVRDAKQTAPGALTETAAPPEAANEPALPDARNVGAETPHEAGRTRNRLANLSGIAAGIAAAAIALAVLPAPIAPASTVAALQQNRTPDPEGIPANVPVPVHVGPALPAPAALRGMETATLHDQALTIGAQDPTAAAIGFARAALRGDARAAFYLGQHFETGDGVPRNATLAVAWYASAAKTQRSARRALQHLTDISGATDHRPAAPPLPLMGTVGADRLGEYVWAAPDGAAARYLIELAAAPDAPPQQHGPFDLSAALLAPAAPARLWRVVSVGPDDARISVSDWHLIDIAKVASIRAAP